MVCGSCGWLAGWLAGRLDESANTAGTRYEAK